jgi:LysM repeat protein
MKRYRVRKGDCLSSIAKKYGTTLKKLWDYPENIALKEKRKDPNVL